MDILGFSKTIDWSDSKATAFLSIAVFTDIHRKSGITRGFRWAL
jgi:hypothetical protein